ncbi:MAG TPA: acetylxylan esterase [Terriglobales bacterium]|nr:acetylxylan esterase [Terriglobales bacterium]
MTTRRRFLAANLLAAVGFGSGLGRSSFAQSQEAGPTAHTSAAGAGVDFWNDCADQLTRTMNHSRAVRMSTLAGIHSRSQTLARVEMIRTKLWQLLGGPLERGDLNAKVTGSLQGVGFRIEKLMYESAPGVVVTANLYLPAAGDPPYPAILAPVGHSENGKAYQPYQHLYQTLARLGYVVLTYDPWGQGERLQYINPKTGRSLMEPTDEHSMAGRPMLLLGQNLALYFAWDGIRGVDYLLTRPEVDPKRIGCTGQSGGGTMTMYLAALEPRIAAAVVNEGNTENVAGPQYDPPGAVDDAEQNVVGSLPLSLDRGDILAAAAPRPLLICYTTHDRGETYSPVYDVATKEVYREAATVYKLLGAEEKIRLTASHLPHGLDYTNRHHTCRWFNRWLKGDDGPITESSFTPFPDAMLNATTTGQVVTSLASRGSVRVGRDRLATLMKARRAQAPDAGQLRSTLTSLLALQPAGGTPSAQVLSTTVRPGMTIEQFFFETESDVRIPGWLLRPSSVHRPPVILHLADDCGHSLVEDPGSCDRLIAAGYAICSITPRGLGIARPRFPHGGPDYYSPISIVAERYSWAWLALGSPVAGQRVHDVIRAIDYLSVRADVNSPQLRILASGSVAIAAQMAALLDRRVQALFLDGSLSSFASLFHSPDYSLDLSWFVPKILQHMDLPDIAACLAPRPCWIRNSVDAAGTILDSSAVKRLYLEASNGHGALPGNIHFIVEHAADPQTTYLDWLRST